MIRSRLFPSLLKAKNTVLLNGSVNKAKGNDKEKRDIEGRDCLPAFLLVCVCVCMFVCVSVSNVNVALPEGSTTM